MAAGAGGSKETAVHDAGHKATRSLGVATTVLPADGVERCPSFLDVAAVPGYSLDAETGASRDGCISLYRVGPTGSLEGPLDAPTLSAGVFDVRWRPGEASASAPCLARAASDGSVAVLAMEHERLEERTRVSTDYGESNGAMCTSVAWAGDGGVAPATLAATRSDGHTVLMRLHEAGDLQVERAWLSHELFGAPVEVWWAEFDARGGAEGQSSLLYTGADDALLKAWDLRGDLARPVHTVRHHGEGVCHVALCPDDAHSLSTGSYDDLARWWDSRALGRGPVQELDLGGGVWRVRYHPTRAGFALAACMYNGCALLAKSANSGEWEVRDRYLGHASITYGCEWFHTDGQATNPGGGTQGQNSLGLAASVSFYDRQLHVWDPRVSDV